ncbi:hypothetical protein [Tautonia plasticadhaerens]|uniref:Uncharacterized protein n=1 Tax=Tautonia plasticadhaerens TaxID=2527974 RepID=A0A518H0V5_9BACT|nr:hypothetical protein [Tautonia plasticadhaerens]QDV34448.1 hypothetical protein ElP_23370 [Tautonia plasticadhaerens]
MRLRPLLLSLPALASLGCVGMDLSQFDDDELARLLDEPAAVAPEGPDRDKPAPGAGEPGPSTVVDDVPEFEPPAPDPPRDEAIIRASEVAEDQERRQARDQDQARDQPPGRDDRLETTLLDRALQEDAEPARDDEPERARGAVVASVGEEEIRLPELTRSVRRRIDRLPEGRPPNRRLVIGMVRAEMESRILSSLVEQQAAQVIGDDSERAVLRASLARDWSEDELPGILHREGLPDPDALDARLAEDGRSLDDLRTAFEARALARELIRREGLDVEDVDDYLDRLRDRFPIASDLIPPGRLPAE